MKEKKFHFQHNFLFYLDYVYRFKFSLKHLYWNIFIHILQIEVYLFRENATFYGHWYNDTVQSYSNGKRIHIK